MFLLTLAAKNLTRYTRRTIITAVAIALGIAMYIIVDSMLAGAALESERNLIWYETGSLRVHRPSWWEDRLYLPLDQSIENPQVVVDAARQAGHQAVTRTRFSAEMILYSDEFGEDGYLPVTVTAITPDDAQVYPLIETLAEGRLLFEGEAEAILLGSWLAEDIGAKVGSLVTITAQGKEGFHQAFDAEIVGLLNCPNPNVNRTLVVMDSAAVDQYLGLEGAVSSVDIALGRGWNLERAKEDLQQRLDALDDDLLVLSWKDLAPDYLAIMSSKQGGTALILLLVFAIAAVGISNTMMMAMYERSAEIGMMRSMGMSERALYRCFFYEAGGIGLLGSLLGLLLGALANIYMVEVGIDLSFMLRDLDMGFRIQSIMRGAWQLSTFATALAGGTLLSVTSAFFPIRRALKLSIPLALARQ